MQPLRFLAAILAALAFSSCTTLQAGPSAGDTNELASGVVASADPRASAAGEEMFRQGGSATDAAIATMIALTVVEPQSSGIGGGGFIVRGSPEGGVQTFDGRETAPAAATPDWFLDEDGNPIPGRDAVLSGLSIGVPGNIAVAKLAHDRHGKLPWAKLFEPAIRLARDGFAMNRRLFESLDGRADRAGLSEAGRRVFYAAADTPQAIGTVIVQEELARSLKAIAIGGTDTFYRGAFARGLAETIASVTPRDGKMTVSDIENYEAKLRDPVCGTYRGYRLCGMGPPSSGGIAVIQILGQLERFDLAALGPNSLEAWHLFLESQRLAYADRELYTGDSDYVDVPVAGLIEPSYLARRSQLIDRTKRTDTIEPGRPKGAPLALGNGAQYPDNGTSHLVAVGPDGTMVSYTSTIEGAFGSGYMYGGFYLNNELTDFSFRPDENGRPVANRVEGGKRPRSSMSPMVIYDPDGEPFMAVGAAGGPMIPIQTARAIVGVIDFGLSLEQAIALPMILGFGERVIVEQGSWLDEAQERLQAMGHTQTVTTEFLFRTNGAIRGETGWEAVYDPRLEPLI